MRLFIYASIDRYIMVDLTMYAYMDSSIVKGKRNEVCSLIYCNFVLLSFWFALTTMTKGSDSMEAAGSSVRRGMKRELASMMKAQPESGVSEGQNKPYRAREGGLVDVVPENPQRDVKVTSSEAKRHKKEQNLNVETIEVVGAQKSDTEETEKGMALSHGEEAKSDVLEGEDRLINNCVIQDKIKRPPTKLKELLETGLLEGLHVRYKRGYRARGQRETDLEGTIQGSGVLCYCNKCNGKEVITANKFEEHAGSLNKRPAEYIYLDNKRTLRDILNDCKGIPLDSLAVAIQRAVCSSAKGPIAEASSGRTKLSCDSRDAPQSSPVRMTDTTDRSSGCVSDRKSRGRVASSNPRSKSQGLLTRKDPGMHKLGFERLAEGTLLSYYACKRKLLEGRKDGVAIFCFCCNTKVSPSQFEAHAGFASRRNPYRNIFNSDMDSLHKLAIKISQRESSVKLATEKSNRIVETCESDLSSCVLCRDPDFINSGFGPRTVIYCDQCEREHHIECLKKYKGIDLKELPKGKWFCCVECNRTHSKLEKLVAGGEMELPEVLLGKINERHAAKGPDNSLDLDIRWRLFQGNLGCEEATKWLSSALTLFHEQFAPIEGKTGADLVSVMVHGGKNGDQQDLRGMHTAVLIVKSLVVCAAVVRVLGQQVAELPLIATKSDFQGLGYFRSLFSCIENMLGSLNVRELVLPSAGKTKSLWTEKFGFKKLPTEQLKMYEKDHEIMTFEGTTVLHKAVPTPQVLMNVQIE